MIEPFSEQIHIIERDFIFLKERKNLTAKLFPDWWGAAQMAIGRPYEGFWVVQLWIKYKKLCHLMWNLVLSILK